ncbi:MAG TPA: hypothetical protein VMV49_03120 [Candidatus Deferrimicrobium sp.]|nr:hypothetical protein [Candidatus Deferrimicrobium sp.]
MRPHHKMLLGMALVFTFILILPTAIGFTESETLESTLASHTRTIFPEDHRGQIHFSFTANNSLTASITDASEVQILYTTYAMNGSCDLEVTKGELYRVTFSKMTGYAVYVEFTVTGAGIPGFLLLPTIFLLLATLGLLYLKQPRNTLLL